MLGSRARDVRSGRLALWAMPAALMAYGMSPGFARVSAACLPTTSLSLFGVHVDRVVETRSCILGLTDAVFATAHAGPLAWTLCLGVVGLAVLAFGSVIGMGLAVHGLLRRVRDWFIRNTALATCPVTVVGVGPRALAGMTRLPDLRPAIVARPSRRRGPPALLPC